MRRGCTGRLGDIRVWEQGGGAMVVVGGCSLFDGQQWDGVVGGTGTNRDGTGTHEEVVSQKHTGAGWVWGERAEERSGLGIGLPSKEGGAVCMGQEAGAGSEQWETSDHVIVMRASTRVG